MRINRMGWARCAAAFAAFVSLTGCDPGTTAAEARRKTGAALDTAADKTVEFTGKALDKTGEALQKAGTAVETTGEKMQE